jgi:hypothetical protein
MSSLKWIFRLLGAPKHVLPSLLVRRPFLVRGMREWITGRARVQKSAFFKHPYPKSGSGISETAKVCERWKNYTQHFACGARRWPFWGGHPRARGAGVGPRRARGAAPALALTDWRREPNRASDRREKSLLFSRQRAAPSPHSAAGHVHFQSGRAATNIRSFCWQRAQHWQMLSKVARSIRARPHLRPNTRAQATVSHTALR